MPLESVPHVLEAAQAVVTDLRGCGTRTYELPAGLEDHEPPAQLSRQEVGLVEAALPQAFAVQRHRHDAPRAQALDDQPLGDELGQRGRQAPPALVLEAMDRRLGRSFVGDGRTQPAQRPQARAAAAFAARRRQLGAASPAHRLLEPAYAGAASLAQPGADLAAAAAARRQDELEPVHTNKRMDQVNAFLTDEDPVSLLQVDARGRTR